MTERSSKWAPRSAAGWADRSTPHFGHGVAEKCSRDISVTARPKCQGNFVFPPAHCGVGHGTIEMTGNFIFCDVSFKFEHVDEETGLK